MSFESADLRWIACPPGSVGGIIRRARSRRRKALLREAAMMVVLAASIGFAAGYFAKPGAKPPAPRGPFQFAGISCGEVRSLLPALMENRLDAAKAMQVRQHIMECPECGRLMKQMQSVSQAVSEPTIASLASSHPHPPAGQSEL
ncbi:MAG: zf-HC2 domain-containing protein [Pirellulales bacterium]